MNEQTASRASCTAGRLSVPGLRQIRSAGSPAPYHPQEPGRHGRSVEPDNSLHGLPRSSPQRQGQRQGSTDRPADNAFDTGKVANSNRLPMGARPRSAPKEGSLIKFPPVLHGQPCVGRPVRLFSNSRAAASKLRADTSTRLNFMCGVRLSEGTAQPCPNRIIASRHLSMIRARIQIISIKPPYAGLAGIWYQPPIEYIQLVGVGFSEAGRHRLTPGGDRTNPRFVSSRAFPARPVLLPPGGPNITTHKR